MDAARTFADWLCRGSPSQEARVGGETPGTLGSPDFRRVG
jgi:hypothetical protein